MTTAEKKSKNWGLGVAGMTVATVAVSVAAMMLISAVGNEAGGAEAVADRRPSISVGAEVSPPPAKVDESLSRKAEKSGKAVNLTIDDGPDPRYTPKALELLKKHGVKAVFCVTGPNAKAHPELLEKIVSAGHRLCNHAVQHDVTMDKKPVAYQRKEIVDASRMIDESSGGERIWYYRAPGGAFTPESRRIAAELGMRPLGWNVDPSDYAQPGADVIERAVKEQIKRGPTVLLHDGGGPRGQTMEALERLLPWFEEQGYAFSFPQA